MSSIDIAREEASAHNDTPASKRRRIAFSCGTCRRRKLKCDRLFPSCSRCRKGGHSETCTYDSEAVESGLSQTSRTRDVRDISLGGNNGLTRANPRLPSVARSFAADERDDDLSRHQPPEDAPSRLYAQEERIRQLENRVIGLETAVHGPHPQWPRSFIVPKPPHAELKPASEQRDSAMKEIMIFRGKHFKTQFYGASHHTSYLSHLPELRLFMKDMIVRHPGLAHAQRELRSTKIKGPGHDDGIATNNNALARLLPPREVADQLVRIYVDNLENTHRILHLPSFWSEYEAYWKAPHEGRPAFVALLSLILATTTCMKEKDPSSFRGDSSVKRETAIMWIRQCDSWLSSQSQKHVTITTFQIHCLSFIAKQTNSVKRKRTWLSAGNLLRLAMSAGLHRDAHIVNLRHATPSRKKVSIFDQEMRRRIWASIAELTLQAAMERGMPAMMRDVFEDCGTPLNLDDEEFNQSTEQLPNSRPISQFTRSSYQHLSRSSWALRLELVSLINGCNSQIPYDDVLLYDKKIMQHLDDIPRWDDQEGLVSQILLQLQLQQLLLFLHRPYARDEPWGSRYDYSAIVHLRSAITILDLHDQLTKIGNSFLCLFRNDVLGAALSICYSDLSSETKPERRLAPRSTIAQLSGDAVHYIEKALGMLEEKIMCVGTGLQEYYCVCAIAGLVRKRLAPEEATNEEHVAADRLSQIIQKVLALQDNYSVAATLASLPNMPMVAPNGSNGVSNGNSLAPNAQIGDHGLLEDFGQDLEGLDLTNIAGWDLDAFWDF